MKWLRLLLCLGLASACSAHAQISFRASASASAAAAGAISHIGAGASATRNNCGSVTPSIPGGANGDLLIALVNSRENGGTVTMPSWNQLYANIFTGQDLKVAMYWRIADGSDPNTVTQSGTCSSIAAQIARFRGVDPVQPFETDPVAAGNVVSQNSGALDTGTETTTLDGSMLLVAGFLMDDRTVTAAGGWSQSFDSALNLSRDLGLSLHYQLQATVGAAAISNWDFSGGGNDRNYGIMMALRPASSLTINVPAGTALNDVMVASVTFRPCSNTSGAACTTTMTPPAGWTLVSSVDQTTGAGTGGYGHRLFVYQRVATAAEPASYTWTFSGTPSHAGAAGAILGFSGVDTASPIVAQSGQTTVSALTHAAPSIDTGTQINTMLVATHSANSSATWTPATGMTEQVDIASLATPDDLGLSLQVSTEALAAAGVTGTRTATLSSPPAADTGATHMLALRPTPPVLQWTMDQSSWNGTAGEVLDASASGLHGRALNGANTATATAAIAGNPGSCQYGSFDGVDDYLEVADNALLDITDELTVLVWIRPTALPTGGNLKTIVSKDGNYEFHLNSAGQINWWWGGGALQLNSNGAVALNTWTHIAIVYSRSGGFQRIYINGAQDPNTNNQTAALATNAMPFQVGADQGFAGRQFAGLIDEVSVYRAALGGSSIQSLMNQTRPCTASIDHFSISHAGSGVACTDQTITITAHDSSHVAVDANGVSISLSTSNNRGTWTGIVAGGGLLSDPTAGDGAATYTFAAGASQVQLSFRYANLAATSETFSFNVVSGGYSEASGSANVADDPSFTLSQAGFLFSAIPTQISGKPSAVLGIQAVRTDTKTGSCTALFASQNRTVQIGAECNNPSACAAAQQMSINGTSIATSNDNVASGAAAYTNVSLAFNAGSQADTVIAYPAAGQISLHARYDLDTDVAGYEMIGGSNPFVVRPFTLRLSDPTTSSAPGPMQPVFTKAGQNFNVTITAVQWQAADDGNGDGVPDSAADLSDNPAALNFGLETVPTTVSLSHALNHPAAGNNPALGGSTAFSGFVSSTKTQAVNWGEVGFINLTATSSDYLGIGALTNTLAGVGRFYPDHFFLGAGSFSNRAGACGATSFTYMNEGVLLALTLQARNAAGTVTQNYTTANSYAKLNPATISLLGLGAVGVNPAGASTNLSARLDQSLGSAGSFNNGVAAITATVPVSRANPDNPDGPYTNTRFGVAAQEPIPALGGDGVAMRSADFNLDVDGAGGNDHVQITDGVTLSTSIRYGRLRMQNAVGSEKLALPIPLETQYWNGAGFVTNAQDSCTSFPRSAIVLSGYTGALDPAGGNCKTFVQQDPVGFAGGVATVTLAAPAGAVGGSVLLTPNLRTVPAGSFCDNATSGENAATAAAMSYLLGRWDDSANPDGSGATAYDDNPSSRAAFGLFGSQPSNFIYFRENF